jgi:hypothetical protein
MAVAEVETNYKERPPGSTSKLRTFRDGWRILLTITNLVRNERPLLFFSLIGLILTIVAVILAIPVLSEYFDTDKVRRFPTAILCMSLGIVAVLCVATGLILDVVAHVRREAKRLTYLQHASPAEVVIARSRTAPRTSSVASSR